MAKTPFQVETIHLPDGEDCLFPADGVRAHLYRPDTPGPRAEAGIVVLPITDGEYEVSTMLATWLTRQGYTCFRMERRAQWLNPDRTVGDLGRLARQTPRDVRTGVDWFLENGGFDPERLGVLGVSMGALQASIAAGTDSRIRAAVLNIGGAGLADMLLTANDGFINEYRAAMCERLRIGEEDLATLIRAELKDADNLEAARTMNPGTTLMVSARFDRVVRPEYGRRLWEAIGRPHRIQLPCGHYSTEWFVPLILRWTRRWFDRHLPSRP